MPNILTKYARDGKVSYQAVVRVDKRRPVKKTFDTYEEAEHWRIAREAEMREQARTPAHEFTLEEALIDYTESHGASRTVSLAARMADAVTIAVRDLGTDSLETLNEPDLNLLETVIEHARQYMGVVVPQNPVGALKARRKDLPYRPITAFEEEKLLARAQTMANATLADVLVLALDTALAQQEILNLSSAQVDLAAKAICMSPSRVIALTPRALRVVEGRIESGAIALFPHLAKNTVQTGLFRLRKYLGLNGPDFNDLRKIATERLARHLSLPEVKEALGYARMDSLGWLVEGRFIRDLPDSKPFA